MSDCIVNHLHMTYEVGWLAVCIFLSTRFIIRLPLKEDTVIIIIIIIIITHPLMLLPLLLILYEVFSMQTFQVLDVMLCCWISGSCIFISCIPLGLLALEDGGTTIFQNVRSHLPNGKASLPRNVEFSAVLLWKPQTLSCQFFCFLPQGLWCVSSSHSLPLYVYFSFVDFFAPLVSFNKYLRI
jgi:hypothetical protein